MADSTGASHSSQYEFEMTAGREEIAEVLSGVVDGIFTGSVRVDPGAEAINVDVPDDLSLEIEFEDEGDELSLELELEWPVPVEDSTDTTIANHPVPPEETRPVSATDGSQSTARFEVFRDRGEEWRWRLRHRNGNIIALSSEGYTRKHNAQKGLRSVIVNSPEAEITEASPN